MRKEQLEQDIYVFVGEAYQANATALINGDEVLLIDGLASRKDAEELRGFIEDELKKQVRLILCTHYMSDHIAALKLFPKAQIIAHKNYLHTFNSQKSLTEEERASFVQPTIEISDETVIRWGRLTLDVFHNPGKTLSSLNIDIPEADLLIVGDEIFGNATFLSSFGTPEMFSRALKRLRSRGRSRVIPGHMGVYSGQVFENAKFYLESLQARVEQARSSPSGENSILEIPMESCLAPQVEASDFEKEFHQINLRLIIERELFVPSSESRAG
ncbi:MAG: MBL fold metallo-hydrolase [Acidobacteria bacterium]|nr:MBL fold metallo-hydrolase [Acidobacteriota bacterium]MCA1639720.1 MBL fold metallo-hydrolase [Acidobacteriota bacterium]